MAARWTATGAEICRRPSSSAGATCHRLQARRRGPLPRSPRERAGELCPAAASARAVEVCLHRGRRVAVVTGGNRGIGLEICRQLASNGVTVVLTARDENRGAEAVSILGTLGLSNVLAHQLDVSDPSSAVRLADFIKEKFGNLDILVNNAAIDGTTSEIGNLKTFQQEVAGMELKERVDRMRKHMTEPYKQAEECLRTNYHGTKAVHCFLSYSPHPMEELLTYHLDMDYSGGEELKQELNNIDSLFEQRLDEWSELFLRDFKDGQQLERRGWPAERGFVAYKVSKALNLS